MSYWKIQTKEETTIVNFVPYVDCACESRMIDNNTFLVKCDEKPKNENTSEIKEAEAIKMGW